MFPTKEYSLYYLPIYRIYYHIFDLFLIMVLAVYLYIFVLSEENALINFVKQFWNIIPRMKRKLLCEAFMWSNLVVL